jgi:methionine-rich copper-binding protein CopC
MLENSVWRQYNSENSFREKLAEFCSMDILGLIEDDKDLYAAMKSKLTKKELKLFAMDSSALNDEEIKKEFNIDDEELEKSKFKLYKKLKQDKTRLSFRAVSFDGNE